MRNFGLLFAWEDSELYSEHITDDRAGLLADIPQWEYDTAHHREGIHRERIRLYVESGQRAIETWLACQHPGGLEDLVAPDVTEERLRELRQANPHLPLEAFGCLHRLRADEIHERLSNLEGILNAALSRFSIGIGDLAERYPTIYSATFLQVYNHMVENAHASRCAREGCDNLFVHQRGRAAYGQYRTQGVKYCSRECSRAQAQRELRRRHRLAQTS